MTLPYRWLLFDADGTLFDYDRAERSALVQTFADFSLQWAPETLGVYRELNHKLWLALERGEVTPEALRTRRFEQLFAVLGLDAPTGPFSVAYLENLSNAAELMTGALDAVLALHEHYRIAVLTNGLRLVQRSRLARSPLRDYVEALIISEEVGYAKPHPGIFDAAFAAMGRPDKTEVLMIGDSLSSDIQGACDYGIDACWFNPSRQPRPGQLPITYEIGRLSELTELLA